MPSNRTHYLDSVLNSTYVHTLMCIRDEKAHSSENISSQDLNDLFNVLNKPISLFLSIDEILNVNETDSNHILLQTLEGIFRSKNIIISEYALNNYVDDLVPISKLLNKIKNKNKFICRGQLSGSLSYEDIFSQDKNSPGFLQKVDNSLSLMTPNYINPIVDFLNEEKFKEMIQKAFIEYEMKIDAYRSTIDFDKKSSYVLQGCHEGFSDEITKDLELEYKSKIEEICKAKKISDAVKDIKLKELIYEKKINKAIETIEKKCSSKSEEVKPELIERQVSERKSRKSLKKTKQQNKGKIVKKKISSNIIAYLFNEIYLFSMLVYNGLINVGVSIVDLFLNIFYYIMFRIFS